MSRPALVVVTVYGPTPSKLTEILAGSALEQYTNRAVLQGYAAYALKVDEPEYGCNPRFTFHTKHGEQVGFIAEISKKYSNFLFKVTSEEIQGDFIQWFVKSGEIVVSIATPFVVELVEDDANEQAGSESLR